MVAARHTAEENSRIELVLPAKQSFSFHFSLDHQDLVAVPALLNAVKLTSSCPSHLDSPGAVQPLQKSGFQAF